MAAQPTLSSSRATPGMTDRTWKGGHGCPAHRNFHRLRQTLTYQLGNLAFSGLRDAATGRQGRAGRGRGRGCRISVRGRADAGVMGLSKPVRRDCRAGASCRGGSRLGGRLCREVGRMPTRGFRYQGPFSDCSALQAATAFEVRCCCPLHASFPQGRLTSICPCSVTAGKWLRLHKYPRASRADVLSSVPRASLSL